MLKRRSRVSTRFVLSISLIYSFIIVLIMFSFLYILKINSNLLRETVIKNNDLFIYNKVDLLINRISEKNVQNTHELLLELKKYGEKDNEILYILLFSKTNDDDFFRLINKLDLNKSVKIKTRTNKIIREKKTNNYLKKGLFEPVIDPQIYTINNIYYKTVYYPFNIKNSNIVIKFLISSSEVITTLEQYSQKINRIKKYSVIIAIGTVITVIITTLLFIYNFTLLIKNISRNIKKATDGSFKTAFNSADDDLNELANSFNSIVSELKERKESYGDLFKLGVDLLKEKKYNDAISVFKTITIMKPDTFGSYFNLGVAYAKQKKYKVSVEMFTKALNINPGHNLTQDYITKVKQMYEYNENNSS